MASLLSDKKIRFPLTVLKALQEYLALGMSDRTPDLRASNDFRYVIGAPGNSLTSVQTLSASIVAFRLATGQ